jgi:actin-related protein
MFNGFFLMITQRRFSFLGLEQSGLAEIIAAVIACLPEDLQGMFWANIGLIGGNTKMPGFRQRLCDIATSRTFRFFN